MVKFSIGANVKSLLQEHTFETFCLGKFNFVMVGALVYDSTVIVNLDEWANRKFRI